MLTDPAAVITFATSSGGVPGMGLRMAVGGLADSAGFRSTQSQRWAAVNAPDKMLWSLSSMGPRTSWTFRCPRAGLMVRRMNPSLVGRVDTSHSAIAAYSSMKRRYPT